MGSVNACFRAVLLIARSRMMWGDNVHNFYKVVGVALVVVAALFFAGVIGG